MIPKITLGRASVKPDGTITVDGHDTRYAIANGKRIDGVWMFFENRLFGAEQATYDDALCVIAQRMGLDRRGN